MNISMTDNSLFETVFSSQFKELPKQYEGNDLKFKKETLESVMDLTAFLWANLIKTFAFVTDWTFIEDDKVKSVRFLTKSFTNEIVDPHPISELPDTVVSMGVNMNDMEIDFLIGQKGCATIKVFGPVAYNTSFNDKEFDVEKNPLYAAVVNAISDSIIRNNERQFGKEKKSSTGSVCINVTDTLIQQITDKIESIESESEREKMQNLISFVGDLELQMTEGFKRFTDWFYIAPNNDHKDQARYVKVFINEEVDSTPEEGLNLGELPETASMLVFSMEKMHVEITAGSDRVIGASFKDEPTVVEVGAMDIGVMSHPRYDELHDMFKNAFDNMGNGNE